MLEKWCRDVSDCAPVTLVGIGKHAPERLYGIFGALLHRSLELGTELDQVLVQTGVKLPERQFYVAALVLDDPKLLDLSGLQWHQCRIHLYCEIRARMTELLAERADGIFALMNGYLIGLLYPKNEPQCVAECCKEAAQFARETLGISCHVTVSTSWTGVRNIERANQMVQDVENSRSFYEGMVEPVFIAPESAITRLTDKEQHTKFEQEFFPAAERICGMVQAGDSAATAKELRKQLRRIAENCVGLPYPNTLNLTVNRFFSLMQYRLMEEELADWRYLAEVDFSRELISSPTLTAFLDAGDSIAERLIAHARERLDSKYASLMREIRAYLEENATDVNIGLTAVARTFHITPRDAAESFRQFYGVSVNDIIHRARVKRAKELLLTTNDSVQDIAEQVGYCSLATMYRAFTSIEGVAPGKLRQSRSSSGARDNPLE